MFNGYVTRLSTERATVEITKKPVSVKASDKGKVYDAKPLLTNETLLTDGENADSNGKFMKSLCRAERLISLRSA